MELVSWLVRYVPS